MNAEVKNRSQAMPSMAPAVQDSNKRRSIGDLLANPKTVEKFKLIAPRHLNPDRLMRIMAQAVYKTPKLAECEPMSLLGAMMACASLGLEPNTPLGHAYLIPFEKKKWNRETKQRETERIDVQLVIGYQGYIDLARRSGSLVSIHADVVYEGDDFSFEYGTNMHLRHVPVGAREARKPIWAYAHAKLADGEAFEVLPYAQVLATRNASSGYQAALAKFDSFKEKGWKTEFVTGYHDSPWVAFEHEMAAKTMVRRLRKWLSMSIEFASAAALDEMSEAGKTNFGALTDLDGIAFDASYAIQNGNGGSTEDAGDEEPEQAKTSDPKQSEQAKSDSKPAEAKAAETTKPGAKASDIFGSQG